MAAAGGQDHFNSGLVRRPERSQIAPRDLKLRIQQRAVNINRHQADGEHLFIVSSGGKLGEIDRENEKPAIFGVCSIHKSDQPAIRLSCRMVRFWESERPAS
jgi:hypothetical protein